MKKTLGEVNLSINNFLKAIGMGVVIESAKSELIKLETERKGLGKHRLRTRKKGFARSLRWVSHYRKNGEIKVELDVFDYLLTEAKRALLELKVRISNRLARQTTKKARHFLAFLYFPYHTFTTAWRIT